MDETAENTPEVPGRKRAAASKWFRRLAIVFSALFAAALITLFTVDIGKISIAGRSLRTIAEGEGTKFLKRPLRIGRISALLTPGKFALDDVVIEGPSPADRPFFAAKRIVVELPWWTLVRPPRELNLDLHIYGWRMTVENWAVGGARLPKLKAEGSGGGKPPKVKFMAVYAHDGQFTYDDHVSNWGVVCPNLNFGITWATNLNTILGFAEFTNGTTRIGKYQPMRTDFRTRFQLQGAKVTLKHIDLVTDGARSHVDGYVNFGNWPEQQYSINSDVDFVRMRELFFPNEPWRVTGHGNFRGTFKFWKTGRELAGQFDSEEAGLSIRNAEWRFPHLHGDLRWTANEFVIPHAESDFLGGSMRLSYGFPMGVKNGTTRFAANYEDVDLYLFTRQFGFTALEPQGRMRGTVAMNWQGKFSETVQGTGETVITPPAGETVAAETLPADPAPLVYEPREGFVKIRPFGSFALAGDTKYTFSGSSLDFDPSWVATPKTFVRFSGHARGGPVNVPFHVTSHDWQSSDRLFTAIMTNFASPVGAIPVGGRGTFDGTLTKEFRAPRIEGRFTGDRMHAWDVTWGEASGDVVIENNYMTLTNGLITYPGGGRVVTSGKYALGYPRADGGEEINAAITVTNMPLEPMKKAFELEDWPVTGTIESASMHLTGTYEKPGSPANPGTMKLVNGTAWDEPFESVTSALVFEGNGGLRLRGMRMEKAGALITGDAWVSWEDNAYSFRAQTAEGTGIPVDKLTTFKFEQAPLTGQLSFSASGDGSFDSPAWSFEGRIPDLYAGGEGVGPMVGKIDLKNEKLTLTVNVESENRIRVTGGGEIALNERYDSNLNLRFTKTSIDPYLKFFAQDMPYSKVIVSGTLNVSGPLNDYRALSVTTNVEQADLTLFAYTLNNDGDVVMSYRDNVFRLDRVRFKGSGTELQLTGSVDAGKRIADVRATGTANLEALQGFYPDLSSGGDASLKAALTGGFDNLVVDGVAEIKNGSLRHPSLPHRLERINGPIVMQKGRVSVDQLRAYMAEGPVTFGGDIVLDGYRPSEYNLSADGRSMHLRILDGLRATVNAHFDLRGPITAPLLSGTVDVLTASYSPRIETNTGYFDLLRGAAEPEPAGPVFARETAAASPVALAIQVRSGVIPFIQNNAGTISGSADLDIRGTASQPTYTGRITLDQGNWSFGLWRYRMQGGLIEFTNPFELDPFFDVTATTRIRAGGQYYDVNLRLSGTLDRLQPVISSEPWLPEFQIISLLLGESADVGRAELLARSAPEELRNQALRTAGVVFLTSPISATVGSVAERVTAIDTVQIVPMLGGEGDLQQLSPNARITLGKRISERLYLTYSRTLTTRTTQQNEIILIEFDQNDQVSWILSRNEDRSYALDFRIRHVFR